ncbi:MAG: Bug family tripartite tricarboxylate transporter substrate binding protein [Geminicoccaceae bacterium]
MNDRRGFLKMTGIASLAGLLPSPVHASPFPSKPINWIVPFSPGGGSDRWSRVLSSVALDVIDQPLRIHNLAGASGTKGWEHMLMQPADGYTILIASPTPVIELMTAKSPAINPENVKIVCFISAFNAILVARPGRPWSTWSGLVDYARAHPGKLKVGMTYSDLVGAALALRGAGAKAELVPYASTSTAVTDMLGGKIDVTSATPSTALSLYPDQVSTLLNATKLPLPKDIDEQLGHPPHAVDLGYAAINFPRWIGVHPETPDDIVAELSEKIGEMLAQKSLKTLMGRLGEEIIFTPRNQAQMQYAELLDGVRAAISSMKG